MKISLKVKGEFTFCNSALVKEVVSVEIGRVLDSRPESPFHYSTCHLSKNSGQVT